MSNKPEHQLSRRERQIMDVIYTKGEAPVAEVRSAMPDPPSYSAVRAMMNILENKNWLTHRKQGVRYIYSPTHSRTKAARSALDRTVRTFFEGSTEQAVATLLEMSAPDLSEEQLDHIAARIERARKEGR